jgi:hypothetical protein
MFIRMMIALSAALVLGTATTTVAMAKGKINSNPRAAFAQSGPASVYAPNRVVVGYDTGGAAIFRGQLTRACLLSLKQQSRC